MIKSPGYYIWTIGCQMNKAESEKLGSLLEQSGYQPVNSAENAGLIILNTCVVRQNAENKVINKLNNLKSLKRKNPGLKLAVTGCFVGSDTASLQKKFPFVDYFFKPGSLPNLPGNSPVAPPVVHEQLRVTSYVPIIQGCNNFCSYCIVPYRRGREISRPFEEIVCEVRELVNRGVKEVTLVGQNVDSYGHDLPGKPDLADLLSELNGISGLYRIRFLTNHPKDMSTKLIDTMSQLDKICEQINLPVQAGDDKILRLMNRGYTSAHYIELISKIRDRIPGIAISTDVIVGFPSETGEQFERTRDLLKNVRFDNVHIAAYSPREGTQAARFMMDDIPAEEKNLRLKTLEKLQENIAAEINAGLAGCILEVLVEGKKSGKWYGRTRTDKLVFFNSPENCIGRLVKVKIEKTAPWSLQGQLLKEAK